MSYTIIRNERTNKFEMFDQEDTARPVVVLSPLEAKSLAYSIDLILQNPTMATIATIVARARELAKASPGRFINNIKELRSEFGLDLKKAKEIMDQVYADLNIINDYARGWTSGIHRAR